MDVKLSSSQKPIVTCEKCGKKVMKTKLRKHSSWCRNKEGGRSFKCDEPNCPKAFKSKNNLFSHVWAVHSEPTKCPISGCNSMIKKNSLSTHMKTVHDRIKEECPNCNKKISYGNLNIHLKVCWSDSSRPYVCQEQGCKSKFKTAADRSHHIWSAHSKVIGCPFPDCRVRMQKTNLARHVRRIHDGFKEKCNNCGKPISYGHIKRHLKNCASYRRL